MADTAPLVTDYASLQTAIAAELNRSDLSYAIKRFIRQCERRMRRDFRIRKLQDRAFTIDADNKLLPTDIASLDSLYHNGPTVYGPIEIVQPSELGSWKGRHGGVAGPPSRAAVVEANLRVEPVPDQSYSTRMTYWMKIEPLSDTNTSNWLLLDHDDIYLYAACLESAPYLKGDARLAMWAEEYRSRAEEINDAAIRAKYPVLNRTAKTLG